MDFTHAITLPGEFGRQDDSTSRASGEVHAALIVATTDVITKVATGEPREFGFTAEAAKAH
jgi:hypothetical protein